MAIRTRRIMTPDGSLPAFLSEQAWPGMWKWALATLCSAEIFSLLAAFAWRGANGRLPDVTTVLVAVPASVFTVLVIVAILWKWLARIPLMAGLPFLARILPLAWLIPLADIVRSAGRGFIVPSISLDAGGYLLASFTGALLPTATAIPIGIRVGIFSAALITAFVVWFTRKRMIQSLVAALITSLALVKLAFLPSVLGAWEFLLRNKRLVSGTIETQREALVAVTNGYWWTNVYDRFPSAVEAQADIAIRLTSGGVMVMTLGVVLAGVFVWLLPSRRRTLAHFFRAWSAFNLALYVLGAAMVTRAFSASPVIHGTWWTAAVLLVLMLASLRIHAVLERCLHRMPAGEDAYAPGDPSEGPVACGDVPAPIATDLSRVALVYGLIAAWTLGWPVFASIIAFLAASQLSRDRLWSAWPWAATVFRAAGAAALALAGFFFMTQHARLTGIAAFVMLVAAGHRIGMETMRKRG